jgi:hypothetical protein
MINGGGDGRMYLPIAKLKNAIDATTIMDRAAAKVPNLCAQ